LIFRIFGYLDAWGDGRGVDRTSFRLGLILLDFCVFFVMVDRRGEDKTSFKSGLILLDFCYWDV
jgi:hypothetical protein